VFCLVLSNVCYAYMQLVAIYVSRSLMLGWWRQLRTVMATEVKHWAAAKSRKWMEANRKLETTSSQTVDCVEECSRSQECCPVFIHSVFVVWRTPPSWHTPPRRPRSGSRVRVVARNVNFRLEDWSDFRWTGSSGGWLNVDERRLLPATWTTAYVR